MKYKVDIRTVVSICLNLFMGPICRYCWVVLVDKGASTSLYILRTIIALLAPHSHKYVGTKNSNYK